MSPAELSETFRFPGLHRAVEIVVDRWGIAHIYAETTEDAFFAQGFNAARDRLFQIDLWRRRGLGRLSEVFGPAYVEHDRAARLFLYTGDMDREWSAYGEGAEAVTTSFTAGINAYLDWLDDYPESLPPEFVMLNYRPGRWEPADVVRIRSHGVAYNLLHEVARAATTRAADVAADLVRQGLQPPCRPHVADGVDFGLPADLLRLFELATSPLTFVDDPRPPVGAGGAAASTLAKLTLAEGSNNWAVAPSRTTTGRPLLAADPHRAYQTPSLRHIVHVAAPGLDVIGAGEPALPGITLGHNGMVAFAFTIFPADTQDLYVYDLDPADPSRYQYGDGFEAFQVSPERIAIKGEEPRDAELVFTRHGPVIHVDAQHGKAYAVRSTWSEPGTAPYAGSLRYLRARTADEFQRALDGWGSPCENHVYADIHGTIGWKAAGLVPRRPGWDGLLPVPGDGRYEWDGFYAHDDFPGTVDPADGFVATANAFNLPADFPRDRQFGYEWPDPARQRRITEVLATMGRHAPKDSMLLQNDLLSVAAREMLALLGRLTSDDQQTAAALALLSDWDTVETAESAAAALYEVWISRHLMPAFIRSVLPGQAWPAVGGVDTHVLRQAMRDPQHWWSEYAAEHRDALLLTTLSTAYAELETSLGNDPARWAWGALHTNQQRHPLGFLDPAFDMATIPVGGSAATINAAPSLATDYTQLVGPSFRMVLDIGAWDNSVAINTPGQSGDPRSPHYRDLVEPWRHGNYIPLLYTRTAIDENATTRLYLLPSEHA